MRCWRGGRKCPSPRSAPPPPQRLAPQPGCLGSGGVSQAESAHLASGKGWPTMLRAWAGLGGLPPPCTTGLECFLPRRAAPGMAEEGDRLHVGAESTPGLGTGQTRGSVLAWNLSGGSLWVNDFPSLGQFLFCVFWGSREELASE